MTADEQPGFAGGARPLPEGRYPAEQSPARRRRWAIGLTVLVIVAGVIIAFIGYKKFSDPAISGDANGYDIIDATTVVVKFTVNRSDPSKPGSCVIRARSKDGSETGRREVYIPPSGDQLSLESQVRTSKPPAVGEVFGCNEDVPDYLATTP